ncbi:MAG: hypothetical protein GF405_04615 [Candidatus Eisenbacteria bacterium]|nr:hypothetical protein [Candidatus Eisenbacteria bacterium]
MNRGRVSPIAVSPESGGSAVGRGGTMRAVIALLAVLSLVFLAGCEDKTTGPGEAGGYPDIDGLIAFYGFDGNMQDETPGGNDATSGTVGLPFVKDHNGNEARAIYVDGTSDSLWIPDHPDLRVTGSITLAAWIEPDGTALAYNAVIDKNYDDAYSLGLHGVAPGDTLTDIRAFIGDVMFEFDDVVPVGVDEWTHIAFTFVDSSDVGRFYVNGDFVGSIVAATTLGTSAADVRLGSSLYGDAYAGAIDQVAIFDRALDETEVGLLYGFD